MIVLQALASLLVLAGQPAAKSTTVRGDCSLSVDGKIVLNIKRTCQIFLFGDGGFAINTREKGSGSRPFHFAYLIVTAGKPTASASWNRDIRDHHAQDPLGDDFRRRGGCWIGRRATICAYRR